MADPEEHPAAVDNGDNLEYLQSHATYYESREWTELRHLTVNRANANLAHPVLSVVSSLGNLEHPIKLIRLSVLRELPERSFPRYDEEFPFEALSQHTSGQCVAISHRWSLDFNQSGSRNDATWLFDNWHNFTLPDGFDDPLLFYDYTSLPQVIGQRSGVEVAADGEPSVLSPSLALTFKAGLECVDLLFSQRAIAIPTKNYLFRYWCFLEYFIMTYKYAKACVVDLVEPLAFDLRVIDGVLKDLKNFIMMPGRTFIDYRLSVAKVGTILSLDGDDTSHMLEAVHAMGQGTTNQEMLSGYYQRIVNMRGTVVDLIKTRVRQCSLTVATDRKWIDSVLERYLKHPELPTISQTTPEEALLLQLNARRALALDDDETDEDAQAANAGEGEGDEN